MQTLLRELFWPLVRAIFFAAFAQGVLLFLKGSGINIPAWLAAMIGNAVNSGAVWWLLVAVIGIGSSCTWSIIEKRSKTKGRHLTDQNRKKLTSALIDRKVALDRVAVIFSAYGGDESREYAEEIANVLRQQGWEGKTRVPLDDDPHLSGLKIWYQPDSGKDHNASRLAEALEDAGIEFDWVPHEPPYFDATLFVYRKP